jgi:transposase-like protein
VISYTYLGLTAAIKRMFQGCSWRRTERCVTLRSLCRVHFLRNLLSHVPKAGQDMVAAVMKAVPVMEAARDEVLAIRDFP